MENVPCMFLQARLLPTEGTGCLCPEAQEVLLVRAKTLLSFTAATYLIYILPASAYIYHVSAGLQDFSHLEYNPASYHPADSLRKVAPSSRGAEFTRRDFINAASLTWQKGRGGKSLHCYRSYWHRSHVGNPLVCLDTKQTMGLSKGGRGKTVSKRSLPPNQGFWRHEQKIHPGLPRLITLLPLGFCHLKNMPSCSPRVGTLLHL